MFQCRFCKEHNSPYIYHFIAFLLPYQETTNFRFKHNRQLASLAEGVRSMRSIQYFCASRRKSLRCGSHRSSRLTSATYCTQTISHQTCQKLQRLADALGFCTIVHPDAPIQYPSGSLMKARPFIEPSLGRFTNSTPAVQVVHH